MNASERARTGAARFARGLAALVLFSTASAAASAALGDGMAARAGAAWLGTAALVVFARALPPDVAWGPVAARRVLTWFAWFAPCWLAALVVYLACMRAAGHAVPPQPDLERLVVGAPLDRAALALTACVAAPLAEEILFRGYLQSALAGLLPPFAAVAATSVAFGLAHGLDYALPIALLGAGFGWLRHRHRALLPAILAHALHNGLMTAMTLLWPQSIDLLYPR